MNSLMRYQPSRTSRQIIQFLQKLIPIQKYINWQVFPFNIGQWIKFASYICYKKIWGSLHIRLSHIRMIFLFFSYWKDLLIFESLCIANYLLTNMKPKGSQEYLSLLFYFAWIRLLKVRCFHLFLKHSIFLQKTV